MTVMDLPAGVTPVMNIKGDKGETGPTGTFASVGATTVPAGSTADVVLSGPEGERHAEFFIPRGLEAVGAADDDEAIAILAGADDTVTGQTIRSRVAYDVSGWAGSTTEAQLKAAMSAAAASGQEVRLRVTDDLVLTDTLVIDIGWVSVDFVCGEVDATAVTNKPAVHVTNTRSMTAIANNRRKITGLTLRGPGKASAGSVGVLFSAASSATPCRGVQIADHEIRAFETGHKIFTQAYLLTFLNTHIYQCGTAVHMPGGGTTYGENVRYFGAGIGTSDVGIRNEHPDGNLHFISPSIDFCGRSVMALAGGVELISPHLEMNSTSSPVTDIPFVTGTASSARLMIVGGNILCHNTLAANGISVMFNTGNASWGGGIRVYGTKFYNTSTNSGFLCGGTGLIEFDGVTQTDGNGTGSGGGSVLTARAKSLLIDGIPTLTEPVDFAVTTGTPSDRYTAAGGRVEVLATRYRLTKIGAETVAFSVFVPVIPGHEYASGFTVRQSTASSTGAAYLAVTEAFVAGVGENAVTRAPNVIRESARTASTVPLVGATYPIIQTFSSTSWNRVAPTWARYFRITFTLGSFAPNEYVTLSEIYITGR